MGKNQNLKILKEGLILSFPIMLGYIPIGIAFGSFSISLGFDPCETILISALIFAGSSQFALITLMNSSYLASLIIPVFLNLRHIIYSSIIAHEVRMKKRYITAFGLTDEVFATAINHEKDENMLLGLELGAYVSWVFGTLLGSFGSEKLLKNEILSKSLSFSLVSLFFGLLIPHMNKREITSAFLGGGIASIFYLVNQPSLGIFIAGILTPLLLNSPRRR